MDSSDSDLKARVDGAVEAGPELEVGEEIDRLAKLEFVAYEHEYRKAAKRFGVRASELDAKVKKARKGEADATQGKPIEYETIEPWSKPVSIIRLLDALVDRIQRHMMISEQGARITALWAMHCYCFDVFTHSPRLVITAPEKECGKTVLLGHILRGLVPKAQAVDNVTPAVFFRLAAQHSPTFLIDEVDSWFRGDSDLPASINGGYERHGGVMRCEGDNHEVRLFPTYCPVAMAGIKLLDKLDPPIISRSIVIELQRALPGELVESYDQRKHKSELNNFRPGIARWVQDNRDALQVCDPEFPDRVTNRPADKWRPLAAIAELAGGDWPICVKQALLTDSETNTATQGEQLLKDIDAIIRPLEQKGQKGIWTETLIEGLCELEDSIWKEWNFKDYPDKRIRPRQLANKLSPYKLKPRTVRIPGTSGTQRGYSLEALRTIIERYTPGPPTTGNNTATQVNGPNSSSPIKNDTAPTDVSDRKLLESNVSSGCVGVLDRGGSTPKYNDEWPELKDDDRR